MFFCRNGKGCRQSKGSCSVCHARLGRKRRDCCMQIKIAAVAVIAVSVLYIAVSCGSS